MLLVTSACAATGEPKPLNIPIDKQGKVIDSETVQAAESFNGIPTGRTVPLTVSHVMHVENGRPTVETRVSTGASPDDVTPIPPNPAGCNAGCHQIDAHTSNFCAGGQGVTQITFVYKDTAGTLFYQTVEYNYASDTCKLNKPVGGQ